MNTTATATITNNNNKFKFNSIKYLYRNNLLVKYFVYKLHY